MGSLEFGAKQAVVNCVKVKKGDNVVIITDEEKRNIADALKKEIKNAGGNITEFIMEDFGERPDDGSNPLNFPQEIISAMKKAQVSFYIAGVRRGEQKSFRAPMLEMVRNHKIRHAHMLECTEEIMCEGMSADYAKIQELSRKVYDIVSKADNVQVTTPAGTDFIAKLNPNYKWVLIAGDITPEQWDNLPAGEIMTCPEDVNGKIVVDGCLGADMAKIYGDIGGTPISLEVKNGRLVKGSVKCVNETLRNEFVEFIAKDQNNGDRIGELGIGTNIGIKKIIGNLLQDEKFPGVHVAFGDPFPDETGAKWECSTHLDCVLRKTTIIVDDRTIMKDGKFLI